MFITLSQGGQVLFLEKFNHRIFVNDFETEMKGFKFTKNLKDGFYFTDGKKITEILNRLPKGRNYGVINSVTFSKVLIDKNTYKIYGDTVEEKACQHCKEKKSYKSFVTLNGELKQYCDSCRVAKANKYKLTEERNRRKREMRLKTFLSSEEFFGKKAKNMEGSYFKERRLKRENEKCLHYNKQKDGYQVVMKINGKLVFSRYIKDFKLARVLRDLALEQVEKDKTIVTKEWFFEQQEQLLKDNNIFMTNKMYMDWLSKRKEV